MDAYSYLYRGEVFANAQTGNMLLFGVNAAGGDFAEAMKYFWPVITFTVGIILADFIRSKIQDVHVHWRQIVLVGEIVLLFAVCWIPQSQNDLANMLISLACGMQVETFRSFRGNGIATTMCIGNLRSGTYNFDKVYEKSHCVFWCDFFLYAGGDYREYFHQAFRQTCTAFFRDPADHRLHFDDHSPGR